MQSEKRTQLRLAVPPNLPPAENERRCWNLLLLMPFSVPPPSECLEEVWKGDMGAKGEAEEEARTSERAEEEGENEQKTHDAGELWEKWNSEDNAKPQFYILMGKQQLFGQSHSFINCF